MKKPKVSVIIAVYGVEAYIEKCARSLFDQTLDDVEFVFVNDCTPDDSITVLEKVLKDYPDRQAQTKIINLEANGGVANARATGMKAATGEYMIHCDPDDHVAPECYATLYDEARKTASDIVVCDYYRETEGRQEYVTQHYGQTPRESIQDFYKVPFFPSLWDTLIRTSLIQSNQIYPYPEINTGEDLNVIFRAFLKAGTLAYVNKAFYHYVQRPGSLTRSKDIKTLWDNNIARNIINLSQLLDNQPQLGGVKSTNTRSIICSTARS